MISPPLIDVWPFAYFLPHQIIQNTGGETAGTILLIAVWPSRPAAAFRQSEFDYVTKKF
jgi:hypothetical protein